MDAFRQTLQAVRARATKLSDEIVPELNESDKVEDARTEALAELSAIRSALSDRLPDDIRGESETEAAKSALMGVVGSMSSLLESAVFAGGVPRQDLTFRDMASEIKKAIKKLGEKAEAASRMEEGGRRRRRNKKTRKGKGKKRMTRRR